MAKVPKIPENVTYDYSTGFWRYSTGPQAGRVYAGRVPSVQKRREIAPAMPTPQRISVPAGVPEIRPYQKPITLSALNTALGVTPAPAPAQEIKQVEDKKYTITFDPTQIMGYERARQEEIAAAIAAATAAYRKQLGQEKREKTFAKTIYQKRYKGREETLRRRLARTRAASTKKLKEMKKEFGQKLSRIQKAQLKMIRQLQTKVSKPRYESMTAEELITAVPAEKMPEGLTKKQRQRYLQIEEIQKRIERARITREQKKALRELPAELEKARGVPGPATIAQMRRAYLASIKEKALAPQPQIAKRIEAVGRALTTGLYAKKAFVVPRAQTSAAARLRRLQANRMLYEMRKRQAMAQQMAQVQEKIPQYVEGVPMAEQVQEIMPNQRYSYRPINPGNYGYQPSFDARDYTSEETQGGFFVPTEKMPQQPQDRSSFFKRQTYNQENPFFVNTQPEEIPRQESNLLFLDSGNIMTPKRRLI